MKVKRFHLGVFYSILFIGGLSLVLLQQMIHIKARQVVSEIEKKIEYKDGVWDMRQLHSEFEKHYPLYVFSSYGFVLARHQPVKGYLDISDLRFAGSFTLPQTLVTPYGEKWRMYSLPVKTGHYEVVGTVVTGYRQPEASALAEIDAMLTETAEKIRSEIAVDNGTVDVRGLDVQTVNPKVAFEIVESGNRLCIARGGLPSYLDTSWVTALSRERFDEVNDKETNQRHLLAIQPVYRDSQRPVGVVVTGRPLPWWCSQDFLWLRWGLILIGVVGLVGSQFDYLRTGRKKITENSLISSPTLTFDPKASRIECQGKEVSIPYASLQYDLCKVLFTKPAKRWEYDELAEKVLSIHDFSKVKSARKKLYDAARAINAKAVKVCSCEVITCEAKTVRLNGSRK
jgi:hypothetical protein